MSRTLFVSVVSLLAVACGGGNEMIDPNDDSFGGSNFGGGGGGGGGGSFTGAEDEPDVVDPEDFAVPPTDEELETGVEEAEPLTAEEIAEGQANVRGFVMPSFTPQELSNAANNHRNVDPQNVVPQNMKQTALAYYDANKSNGRGLNNYMVVINMGLHSKNERFFMIDMQSGAVTKTVVAHGSGSDRANTGTPNRFSNTPNSNMTSLGFYRMGEVYAFKGRSGMGVRLDGLDSTNNKARARGVVFHPSSYVSKGRAKQGRSQGCPAVPSGDYSSMRDKLKNGALMYIHTGADTKDSCAGRADGYYCSEIQGSAAFECRGGSKAGASYCESSSKTCKGGGGKRATTTGGKLACE